MNDEFVQIITKLATEKDYIKINELKAGYSYKIYARNAFVGIWVKDKKGFLISRYKVGLNPRLCFEYHWDWDEKLGTAKPLEKIEKCPIPYCNTDGDDKILLKYLDNLEEMHPILPGFNSLKDRKKSAKKYEKQLSGKFKKNDPKIHELIKSGVLRYPKHD